MAGESAGKIDAVVLAETSLVCAVLAAADFASPVTALTFCLHSPPSAQILASSYFFLTTVVPAPPAPVATAVPVATLAAVPDATVAPFGRAAAARLA